MEINLTKRFWYMGILSPFLCPLITTVDKDGRPNAAPFSFITPVGDNPPLVLLACEVSQATPPRDTLANIRETGEFVVNIPPEHLLRQLLICSKHYPKGVNEINEARLTEKKSKKVRPPSIEECIAWVECQVESEVQPGDHVLLISRAVHAECKDEFVSKNKLDLLRAKPILHAGGRDALFLVAERSLTRPKGQFRKP